MELRDAAFVTRTVPEEPSKRPTEAIVELYDAVSPHEIAGFVNASL